MRTLFRETTFQLLEAATTNRDRLSGDVVPQVPIRPEAGCALEPRRVGFRGVQEGLDRGPRGTRPSAQAAISAATVEPLPPRAAGGGWQGEFILGFAAWRGGDTPGGVYGGAGMTFAGSWGCSNPSVILGGRHACCCIVPRSWLEAKCR